MSQALPGLWPSPLIWLSLLCAAGPGNKTPKRWNDLACPVTGLAVVWCLAHRRFSMSTNEQITPTSLIPQAALFFFFGRTHGMWKFPG